MGKDIQEFSSLIKDLTSNEVVQNMKNFRQHYDTNCYEHCKKVAFYSYLICKKYGLDYRAVARAAFLHDLFLYDWRSKENRDNNWHAFSHPRISLDNAKQITDLNLKEQEIILKHMWPLTIIFPKYKETYIVSLVDKYCALEESFEHYKKNRKLQKFYRYSYLFFGLLIFRII